MDVRRAMLNPAWPALPKQAERCAAVTDDPYIVFDMLYQVHYRSVLGFLRFLVEDAQVAEDLTSLVFEKALKHLADLRSLDAAKTWLLRIARNCASDHFQRTPQLISLDQLAVSDHPQIDNVEEALLAREEQRSLQAHLSQLSEREREVIGLRFVLNMSNREIARILQLPEGTVGSILFRALGRLRVALREERGKA